jgi:aminocarboxymuconate-semialdehyde decarboxylase
MHHDERADPLVDLHHHCLPASLLDSVRAAGNKSKIGVGLSRRWSGDALIFPQGRECPLDPAMIDLGIRDEGMLSARIDVAAVSVLPLVLSSYLDDLETAQWYAREVNNGIADDVARSSQKLHGLADVPLQDPAAAALELRRAMAQLGFVGAQIPSHVGNQNLDAPELDVFWEAAEELGAVLFIHPAAADKHLRLGAHALFNLIGNPLETSIAAASLIFGGVLTRFPGLRFVLAHAGGFVPWIYPRWEHGSVAGAFPDIPTLDTPMTELLRRFWYDTIIYKPEALQYLIDTVGADRIVVGTDSPALMGESDPRDLLARLPDLPVESRRAILGGNALGLLGSTG